MKSRSAQGNPEVERGRLLAIVLFQAGFMLLMLALALFLPARRLDWFMGWMMLVLY